MEVVDQTSIMVKLYNTWNDGKDWKLHCAKSWKRQNCSDEFSSKPKSRFQYIQTNLSVTSQHYVIFFLLGQAW